VVKLKIPGAAGIVDHQRHARVVTDKPVLADIIPKIFNGLDGDFLHMDTMGQDGTGAAVPGMSAFDPLAADMAGTITFLGVPRRDIPLDNSQVFIGIIAVPTGEFYFSDFCMPTPVGGQLPNHGPEFTFREV